MHTQNRKLIRKQDLIAILAILITGIVTFIVIRLVSEDGASAVISVDGNVISEHSLSSSSEFTIKEAKGAVIEINDGGIRVKSSDCPDKICVKTGYISKEGERIVCLPKKLIIEVKTN